MQASTLDSAYISRKAYTTIHVNHKQRRASLGPHTPGGSANHLHNTELGSIALQYRFLLFLCSYILFHIR